MRRLLIVVVIAGCGSSSSQPADAPPGGPDAADTVDAPPAAACTGLAPQPLDTTWTINWGGIAVHPDGTGAFLGWNAGDCCGTASASGVDDVGLVGAILDRLETEMCVDTARIYSTGFSNGGFLSHRLGCELSDRIAAIAPV